MQKSSIIPLTNKDYRKVYQDLEKFCMENTKLLLFGEFGDASCPSISDLDVLICLEDDNFLEAKGRIIEYIEKDDIRKYLFFHDPLIISRSILPYLKKLHTCYDLKITTNKNDVSIPSVNDNELSLLNIIWTTFLMSIGPGILSNEKFTDRDYLLVLKNICQSIANVSKNSDALVFSEYIRSEVLKNKLSRSEIVKAFGEKLKELYDVMNQYPLKVKDITVLKPQIRTDWNKYFYKSNNNYFHINNDIINIYLNEKLYNLMYQFYQNKKEVCKEGDYIGDYIRNAKLVNDICIKQRTKYPFVSPFAYNFFRSDFKFLIKRVILSI